MNIVTNKFRADVGLRDKYFVEEPLEYVFHYLKSSIGPPTNPGLMSEICLNISDNKLYKFDGTNWIDENVTPSDRYLFAGHGSNPATGCTIVPDMQIYAQNGTSYSKRLIRNGNVIFVKKSSRDFPDNNLLVYDHNNNIWLKTNAAVSDSEFGSKLDQQIVAGSNVNISYNNVANTLTISSTGSSTTINEDIDDRVADLIQAGEGIDISYDDVANTLTIDSELCESGNASVNKGVASFNSESFIVSSGFVSISNMDGGGFV